MEFRVTKSYREVTERATVTVSMRVEAEDHTKASEKADEIILFEIFDRPEDWQPVRISVQNMYEIISGDSTELM